MRNLLANPKSGHQIRGANCISGRATSTDTCSLLETARAGERVHEFGAAQVHRLFSRLSSRVLSPAAAAPPPAPCTARAAPEIDERPKRHLLLWRHLFGPPSSGRLNLATFAHASALLSLARTMCGPRSAPLGGRPLLLFLPASGCTRVMSFFRRQLSPLAKGHWIFSPEPKIAADTCCCSKPLAVQRSRDD